MKLEPIAGVNAIVDATEQELLAGAGDQTVVEDVDNGLVCLSGHTDL